MIKIFFIIIIFLFQTFPAFSNLNEKGIICKCIKCSPNYFENLDRYKTKNSLSDIGFRFSQSTVVGYEFYKYNDDILFRKRTGYGNYTTTTERIVWSNDFYKLNRKTLILNIYGKHNGNIIVADTRQCRVFLNEKSFDDGLNILKDKYQNEINKKMKDNKI